MESYINCETAESKFSAASKPCTNGDVSVEWLMTSNLDTGNPAFQRERVASVLWNKAILETVLTKIFAGIPEIHIRVIKLPTGGYKFEIIDGQQRVTAIQGFLRGEFNLPKWIIMEGKDIAGLSALELEEQFPDIYQLIREYRISCKWYQNLSDAQTSDLYVNILNNVCDQKPQEIRNAVLGVYSNYIREQARFKAHDLFTRITIKNGRGEKEQLKHFSDGLVLRGRMEVDEWVSELAYLKLNGLRGGITQNRHTEWVKQKQNDGGKYSARFTDKKIIDDLLNFGFEIIDSVAKGDKPHLNAWTSMFLVLYADDLKSRHGKIIPEKYTKAFFDVYDRWSCEKKKLYMNETTANGAQLGPFKSLFGGKNVNGIATLIKILDREVDKDREAFGIIEMDLRVSFPRSQIIAKWKEQNYKCFYTGVELDEDQLAGDHFIPRSWGIAAGGITEYSNLVVCSGALNRHKSNIGGEEFMRQLNQQGAMAAE